MWLKEGKDQELTVKSLREHKRVQAGCKGRDYGAGDRNSKRDSEGRGFREREWRMCLAGRSSAECDGKALIVHGNGLPSVMGKGTRCAWEWVAERDDDGKGRSLCLGMGPASPEEGCAERDDLVLSCLI
jgi:hypothetical protein